MPVTTTKKNVQNKTGNNKIQGNGQTKSPKGKGVKNNQLAMTNRKKLDVIKMGEYLKDDYVKKKIEGNIQSGKEACKNSFYLNVSHSTKRIFGCNGGVVGKYKSDKIGYDMRTHLKGQGRDWARHEVDIKKDEYLDKEFQKIDGSSNFANDEERQLAKDELKDTTALRTMFLKNSLYSMVKGDVEERLNRESNSTCDEIYSQYENDFKDEIEHRTIGAYKWSFRMNYLRSKEMGISHVTALDLAEGKALEAVKNRAPSMGVAVFKEKIDEILKKAEIKAESRRSIIIKELNGKEEKNKVNFQNTSDYSKARDYIYDGQGVSLEERKDGIKDKIEENHIEATNVNKGLLIFTRPLVGVVPHPGDSASASGTISIPIPNSPAYIFFKLSGNVERDDDGYVTAKFRAAVGAGGGVGIANIHGELGGFLQVKGQSAEHLSMLLSYVLYRQFRESKIVNHHMTDAIWGMGGRTGEGKDKEADAYGGMMERTLFGGSADSSASIGSDLGFGADIGGSVGGSISASASAMRQYSKTSFEKGNGKGRLGKIEGHKFLGQKSKGDMIEKLKIEGSVAGVGMEASLGLRGSTIQNVTIGLNMSLGGAYGGDKSQMATKIIQDIILHLKSAKVNIEKVYEAYKNRKNKKIDPLSDEAARVGSEIGIVSSDITEQINAMVDTENTLASKIGEVDSPVNGQSTQIADSGSSLAMGVEYEWKRGSKGNITFSLNSENELSLDLFLGGISLQKSRRLASWSTGDDMENLTKAIGKGKNPKERLSALKEGVSI